MTQAVRSLQARYGLSEKIYPMLCHLLLVGMRTTEGKLKILLPENSIQRYERYVHLLKKHCTETVRLCIVHR